MTRLEAEAIVKAVHPDAVVVADGSLYHCLVKPGGTTIGWSTSTKWAWITTAEKLRWIWKLTKSTTWQ